jgi:putative colanic acid biosynthesis acetyltransferase WcaF
MQKQPQYNPLENRRNQSYSLREYTLRCLWTIVIPFFRLSPRPFFFWRNLLLRLLGADIGKNVHIYPTVNIFFPWMLTVKDGSAIGDDVLIYNLGPVVLGERVTISHRAHLCAGTHDLQIPHRPLIRSPITVEDGAWICADVFIGPGVRVGSCAIVGARAAVFRDITAHTVVGGNPARELHAKKR